MKKLILFKDRISQVHCGIQYMSSVYTLFFIFQNKLSFKTNNFMKEAFSHDIKLFFLFQQLKEKQKEY